MQPSTVAADNWQQILDKMPRDFAVSALSLCALVRKRVIRSANDLLRAILLYCACDLSFDETALYAHALGIGDLDGESVRERLRKAGDWLGHLVMRLLQERGLGQGAPGLHVRVVDATTIKVPGSKGTNWRIHLAIDLETSRISSIELTGPEGGETLVRHEAAPGRVFLADRGYAHRRGVATVSDQGAHVVVRLNWQNFPLEDPEGNALGPMVCIEKLEPDKVGDFAVRFRYRGQVYTARLLVARIPDEAIEKAEKRATRASRKKHHDVSPNTLRAARYTFVLTTLPSDCAPAEQVMALYRLRWQIELVFKRLKSNLQLDHLRAKSVETGRAYLYGKLLAALVTDEMQHGALSFSPQDTDPSAQPISLSRLHKVLFDNVAAGVKGVISLTEIVTDIGRLAHHLRDAPRKRRPCDPHSCPLFRSCVATGPPIGT